MTTSGDAMGRMREKCGSGVAGLPLSTRIVVTVLASVPAASFFLLSLSVAAPGNALSLAVGLLFAFPLYLLLPTLWQRNEESLRSDWYAQRVQRHLELEIGARELAPRVDHDPARPIPKRW